MPMSLEIMLTIKDGNLQLFNNAFWPEIIFLDYIIPLNNALSTLMKR